MARPSSYTPELAAEIAARLVEQPSLKAVCNDDTLPALRTVMQWSAEHPEFQQMLDRARVDKADHVLEEALEISNENVLDSAQATRQRTRVDARLKVAAKLNPAKYAERLATGQAPELPVPHLGLDDMSLEQKRLRILELARGVAFILQQGVQVADAQRPPSLLSHEPAVH